MQLLEDSFGIISTIFVNLWGFVEQHQFILMYFCFFVAAVGISVFMLVKDRLD